MHIGRRRAEAGEVLEADEPRFAPKRTPEGIALLEKIRANAEKGVMPSRQGEEPYHVAVIAIATSVALLLGIIGTLLCQRARSKKEYGMPDHASRTKVDADGEIPNEDDQVQLTAGSPRIAAMEEQS